MKIVNITKRQFHKTYTVETSLYRIVCPHCGIPLIVSVDNIRKTSGEIHCGGVDDFDMGKGKPYCWGYFRVNLDESPLALLADRLNHI